MSTAHAEDADAGRDGAFLESGTVVAERYRVERLLGEGGMGAVYLAEHVHMRKTVAIKVLHHDMCSSPEIVARFEREAIAAGQISHPNVVAATDFGRLEDGSFFLVLEYVAGTSLRELIEGGPVEPTRALVILRGILTAVGAAHAKGIVHRDLKPENVMLTPRDGEPDFVKVLDFGIAKLDVGIPSAGDASRSQPLTRMGAVFGTPDYMAPEQAMGEPVDLRADLYTIGVIFFELLTGERPFKGGAVTVLRQHVICETPPLPDELAARIDPRADAVLVKLMAKSKDARYASASEAIAAIDDVLAMPAPSPSSSMPSVALLPTMVAQPAVTVPGDMRRLVTPARVAIAAGAFGLMATLFIAVAIGLARKPAMKHGTLDEGSRRRGADSAATTVSSSKPALAQAPAPAQAPGAQPVGGETPKRTGGSRGGIHIPPPSTWFR